MMTGGLVDRARTAISRPALSRPIQLALDHGLISESHTLLDYGCGRGDDVRNLLKRGMNAIGWDPAHGEAEPTRPANVTNLGYVVNVIENSEERALVLRKAWHLTTNVLIIAARLDHEKSPDAAQPFGDGFLTGRRTFQKFYEQAELRDWISTTLDVQAVAGGPGVFYVFRNQSAREAFIASQFAPRFTLPRASIREAIYKEHETLFAPVLRFLGNHGRFPDSSELPELADLVSAIGSTRRTFEILKRVVGIAQFEQVRIERSRDVVVYLALSAFSGRPRFRELPTSTQRDIKLFFGTYTRATQLAEHLLYSAGNSDLVRAACGSSHIGKLTPAALYIHRSALDRLDPILRVYEGCARVLIGDVTGANIIKLGHRRASISYLRYPTFDSDAHPSLAESCAIDLCSLKVRYHDYSKAANPYLLHRKECFVSEGYPGFERFKRLTISEERAGLFDDARTIGTKEDWAALLDQKQLTIRGHRLHHAVKRP